MALSLQMPGLWVHIPTGEIIDMKCADEYTIQAGDESMRCCKNKYPGQTCELEYNDQCPIYEEEV